jgi:hypothetical protein
MSMAAVTNVSSFDTAAGNLPGNLPSSLNTGIVMFDVHQHTPFGFAGSAPWPYVVGNESQLRLAAGWLIRDARHHDGRARRVAPVMAWHDAPNLNALSIANR